MPDFPVFDVMPPLRCYHPAGGSPVTFCGELARWYRPGSAYRAPAFYCDRHRSEIDTIVPDDVIVRRVRIANEVFFAGVAAMPAVCQAEALQRLERAIQDAGGLLNVFAATSGAGRISSQGGPGIVRAVPGVR